MASGSISVSGHHWSGRISWSASPISGQNASSVYAEFYVTGWGSAGTFWGMLTVGGSSQETSWNGLTDQEEKYIGSAGCTVAHDSEGNGSVYIGMNCVRPSGAGHLGETLEGGETVSLDHIVQAGPSRISFSQDPIQMGKKLLISIHRDQPDCTHRLTYVMGSLSGTIGENLTSSAEWTVPDLWQGCMDALSGTCQIICETFRRGRSLGSTRKNLTVQVPDPVIPQLSQGVLGEESKILCQRKSAGFRVALSFLREQEKFPLGEGSFDSFLWTPGYDLAKLCPDLKEFSGQILAETWLGTAKVGEKTCAVRLTVPENEQTRPEISEFTLQSILYDLPEGFPLIMGKTGIQGKILASAPLSLVDSLTLTVGKQQAFGENPRIDYLNQAGSLQAVARCRDLRGFEVKKALPIQILPYGRPRCLPYEGMDQILCCRGDDAMTPNPRGLGLTLWAGIRHSEILKDGRDLNPFFLRFRIRKQGETEFSPWKDLLKPGEKQGKWYFPEPELDLHSSYLVELSASDSLKGEDVQRFSIMTEAVSFSLYDGVDGAAFGKYAESPHVVDIAPHMLLQIRGGMALSQQALESLKSWNLALNYPAGKLWVSLDPQDPGLLVGGLWEKLPESQEGEQILYRFKRLPDAIKSKTGGRK